MKIVATFGWSWEPEWLVDQLRENLAWVDGFAMVDDRARFAAGRPWGHEGEYRRRQRAECERLGADWVLVTAPDERWDVRAGEAIRQFAERAVVRPGRVTVARVRLRELYEPLAYRADGGWGNLRRTRLYRLRPGQRMQYRRLHCRPCPLGPVRRTDLDVQVYDLKLIEPGNRQAKVDTFTGIDSVDGQQGKNTNWQRFTDTAALELTAVPPGRGYRPEYRPFVYPGWPTREA